MIANAIAELRALAEMPLDPARRGPVLMSSFFEESNVVHVALPALTCGRVVEYLREQGAMIEPFANPDSRLVGFLFFAGNYGTAFVNADDILPRRRFTAAHELGHAVLHRNSMGQYIADAIITENDDPATEMEREANRFAVELLMPREVCEARANELRAEHGACPRGVLAYRLASELLVSREAMRYRLKTLRIGDDE